MIEFNKFRQKGSELLYPERLSHALRMLVCFSKTFFKAGFALKLRFYSYFLNFVRVIALYIIYKNKQHCHFIDNTGTNKDFFKKGNDRILSSLHLLLIHFDMISVMRDQLIFSRKLIDLKEPDWLKIEEIIENNRLVEGFTNSTLRKMVNDFLFIRELIGDYRGKEDNLVAKKQGKLWADMLKQGKLDYEVRLCETLFQLSQLKVGKKIPSPFDESYYTESGRNAFQNFTQLKFGPAVKYIDANNCIKRVLDIGCGYGDYIHSLIEILPDSIITGIELQEKVYNKTQERFAKQKHIEILNIDFFDYLSDQKEDLVLLNYVLFYFTYDEKKKLFQKIASQLAEQGSILICQYFQGIDRLKKELAMKQHDLSVSRKIEMYYSNKILFANALWNNAADTFSESAEWDELIEILDASNLEVKSLTNADKFYFSLFVEVKKK